MRQIVKERESEKPVSSEGSYMTSVVITALTVITFFILILAFLYIIWGKEETPEKET